eukprot:CAMPEP_0113650616 /NCGR_PEP_ID=MMETSP0017_2-20120614/26948_1 /TAXON_ID=2856 /ORGANISM="Cylindrotheca closterium" /LENGTH=66 /DNA_ID=CAMNT_0000563169 /DNA_START=35 /DNA_END=232 /DNA_ORIENTATION=- /assembly_acc=CAM_ASM_000147
MDFRTFSMTESLSVEIESSVFSSSFLSSSMRSAARAPKSSVADSESSPEFLFQSCESSFVPCSKDG